MSTAPATPRPNKPTLDLSDCESPKGPHTPISFMPQPSSRMVLMSSASYRPSRKGADDRAMKLLALEDSSSDEEEEEDGGSGGASAGVVGVAGTVDINTTPKTPPHTPLTLSSTCVDSNLPASPLFSFDSLWELYAQKKLFSAKETAVVAVVAVMSVLLLLAMVVGTEEVQEIVEDGLAMLWEVLVAVSMAIEMGIEGVGWVLGRGVARFGRGFEEGYRI